MERIVEPEWLDRLAPADPRAQRSRRDIQRLNRLIGHDRLVAKALKRAFGNHPPNEIVDLGAGNGRFFLPIARRLDTTWTNRRLILVDSADGFDPDIAEQFRRAGWNAKVEIFDALEWLRGLNGRRIGAVIGNHFFHQMHDSTLSEMFAHLSKSADAVIAAEPRRGAIPLLASHFVWLFGCASVTRYDAPVSFRAGFAGQELSALWPDKKNWELTERPAGWLSHLFVARRNY
jgi:hypothetical protein